MLIIHVLANTYEKVTSITIPAKSFFVFSITPAYQNTKGLGISVNTSSTDYMGVLCKETTMSNNDNGVTITRSGYLTTKKTYYIWAKWNTASSNSVEIYGFYFKLYS